MRVLKKELSFSDKEIASLIKSLPIELIGREIYEKALIKTKARHKADKPVEALSLILNCKVISADKHFENRIDINKLLEELGE